MPFPGLKTDQDRADVIAFFATATSGAATAAAPSGAPPPATPQQTPTEQNPAPPVAPNPSVAYVPDANYTLRSGIAEGRMATLASAVRLTAKSIRF